MIVNRFQAARQKWEREYVIWNAVTVGANQHS
jgi:hypothetical protein